MLDISRKLTFDTMLEIYKSGYTRIPVYENSREYIKGILFVKDLILIDPDDEITLEAITTFRCALSTVPAATFKMQSMARTWAAWRKTACSPMQRTSTSTHCPPCRSLPALPIPLNSIVSVCLVAMYSFVQQVRAQLSPPYA